MPDPQFGTLYQILDGEGSQFSTFNSPILGIGLPIMSMVYENPGGLSAMPTDLNLDSITNILSNHGNFNGQEPIEPPTELPYVNQTHDGIEAASPTSLLEQRQVNANSTSNLGRVAPSEVSYIGGVTFEIPISAQYDGGASLLDDLTPPMAWADYPDGG